MAARMQPQPNTRTTWEIDPARSTIGFSAGRMMATTIKGQITGVRGTIRLDEANLGNSGVEAEIDARTLQTGVEQWDARLKSADFLDVDKYPTIAFASAPVEPEGDERAEIRGSLTIHGVTRETVVGTELTGFGKNPQGKPVVGFAARATLNLKDFGLVQDEALEGGETPFSDTICIEIDVQAVKRD